MLLHALGSAAAAAYALGISTPPVSPDAVHKPPSTYVSMPSEEGGATALSWLLLAAARSLQVDIAEHWSATQLSAELGGGVCMTAESLLLSEYVRSLPETVIATGPTAEPHHPFSSQLSRASLYAGKLVWCNGSNISGMLDGIRLPVQTAIGLPLRNHVGDGAAFVLYSLRRLEQSTTVTYFLAQLQVLAAALNAAVVTPPPSVATAVPTAMPHFQQAYGSAPQPAPEAPACMVKATAATVQPPPPRQPVLEQKTAMPALKAEFSSGSALGALVHSNHPSIAQPAPTARPPTVHTASAEHSQGRLASYPPTWPAEAWANGEQQGPVMSTEQVLNLIDCLGGDRISSRDVTPPPAASPGAEAPGAEAPAAASCMGEGVGGAVITNLSRRGSALALALEPFGSIEDSLADFSDSFTSDSLSHKSSSNNSTNDTEPVGPPFAVAKAGVLPRDAAMLPIAEPIKQLCLPSAVPAIPLQHSLSGGCSAEMVSLTVSAPNAAFH